MADTPVQAESLTHREAREIVDRALAKASQLRLAGTFVVVDGGGHVVSISVMDGRAPDSILNARSMAVVSARSHRTSDELLHPSVHLPTTLQASLVFSFSRLYPEATYPTDPGGKPIVREGRVIGGFAVDGIGRYTKVPGVDPSLLRIKGRNANALDLITWFALDVPYLPKADTVRLAADENELAHPVRLPLPLDEARRIADKAIAKAREKGVGCSLTVVDEYGVVVQQDRMDGGPAMYVDLSEAKAITAVNFQRPTSAVAEQLQRNPVHFDTLNRIVKFKVMPEPGGLPIICDGRIIGGLGVAGGGNAQGSEEIALAALS